MFPIENWLTQDINYDILKRVRGRHKDTVQIFYGYGEASFGAFLAAFTEWGICWFEPHPGPDAIGRLRKQWEPAVFTRSDERMQQQLLNLLYSPGQLHPVHMCGTEFQLRVWESLICVPCGGSVTYGDLAKMLGNGQAARALGNAVGANNIAILIPCHRVRPVSGEIGKYRWGTDMKRELLEQEKLSNRVAA